MPWHKQCQAKSPLLPEWQPTVLWGLRMQLKVQHKMQLLAYICVPYCNYVYAYCHPVFSRLITVYFKLHERLQTIFYLFATFLSPLIHYKAKYNFQIAILRFYLHLLPYTRHNLFRRCENSR